VQNILVDFVKEEVLDTYKYHTPGSIREAIQLAAGLEDAFYIAGGTDIMSLVKQGKLKPKHLVSLKDISDMTDIVKHNGLRLGSGVALNDIENNHIVLKYYTAFCDAANNLSTRQKRKSATLGGAVLNATLSDCIAVPLLLFDAHVSVAGIDPATLPTGEGVKGGFLYGNIVTFENFFLSPGKTILKNSELVKDFYMQSVSFDSDVGSAYIKLTRGKTLDLAMTGIGASIAIKAPVGLSSCIDALATMDSMPDIVTRFEDEGLQFEHVRFVVGTVKQGPKRIRTAESVLQDKTISKKAIDEITEIIAAETKMKNNTKCDQWYRKEMIKLLVNRVLLKSIDRLIRAEEPVHPEKTW